MARHPQLLKMSGRKRKLCPKCNARHGVNKKQCDICYYVFTLLQEKGRK